MTQGRSLTVLSLPTLRRRLIVQLGILIAGTVTVAACAIVGIGRMHEDNGLAIRGYRQLREACEVGFHLAQAQTALRTPALGAGAARRELDAASIKLREANDWLDPTEPTRSSLQRDVADAVARLHDADPVAANASVQRGIARLANLIASVRTTVSARQESAAAEKRMTIGVVGLVCGLIVAAGALVSIRQYRSVMRPIDRLSAGLRAFAGGDLARRVDESGDREFVHLSREFNRMAGQLEELCVDLTRRVEVKSRELVRSERLASVGYLAAGVAHEINNPLGIIAGYGERAMQHLRHAGRCATGSGSDQLQRSLEIICEETFRCKTITDRLLSLARPGAASSSRTPTSLDALAQDVIDNLAGLCVKPSVSVRLTYARDDDLCARVNGDEIKQVLLNLLLNALAAVDEGGRIEVSLARVEGHVRLTICDDGSGMDADTLNRVFEPFFSDRARSDAPRGTGLGLSITHAIVADHGGTIRAESDGPGRGSRFTVTLPAASHVAKEVDHAAA